MYNADSMHNAPRRPSNVSGMLLAGQYWYTDFPGAEPQRVDVTYEEGDAVVRFTHVAPEDAGLVLLRRDMTGEFARV